MRWGKKGEEKLKGRKLKCFADPISSFLYIMYMNVSGVINKHLFTFSVHLG